MGVTGRSPSEGFLKLRETPDHAYAFKRYDSELYETEKKTEIRQELRRLRAFEVYRAWVKFATQIFLSQAKSNHSEPLFHTSCYLIPILCIQSIMFNLRDSNMVYIIQLHQVFIVLVLQPGVTGQSGGVGIHLNPGLQVGSGLQGDPGGWGFI